MISRTIADLPRAALPVTNILNLFDAPIRSAENVYNFPPGGRGAAKARHISLKIQWIPRRGLMINSGTSCAWLQPGIRRKSATRMQQRSCKRVVIPQPAVTALLESLGIEMRKMLGFSGSHLLYFLADRVDAVMQKTGSRWLFPLYSKLLVRSADVENWGGGGGAWGAMWAGQK